MEREGQGVASGAVHSMTGSTERELTPQFERLGCAGAPSQEERVALASTVDTIRNMTARHTVVTAHRDLTESVFLIEGFVSRQRELPDGRRQILAIHVPGDFVDLHGLLLKRLDHDVCALSSVRFALASHERLRAIAAEFPALTRKLWFVTTVDAAIHRQWIAMLSRPAVERVAHFFCELHARLSVVGRITADGYALPLTQTDLADATALTPVHVNRTLRHLRERGLVNFRSGRVSIGDMAGLEKIARFDPDYLYLHRGAI